MKKNILIINQKKYDFTTEKGERFNGIKLSYLEPNKIDMPNLVGYAPFVVNSDNAINADQIPGIFEAEIFNVPGPKGQAIEKLCNFKFVKNVDFATFFNNK